MSIFSKLGKVGSTLLATTGPVGIAAAAAINVFLDEEDQVTQTDTVESFEAKLDGLPRETQVQVMNTYYDYLGKKVISDNNVLTNKEDNYTEQLRIMEGSDIQLQVRPNITKWMAIFVISISTIILAAHTCDVMLEDSNEFDVYLIGTLLFLPTWVIQKYFDRRSDDKALKANLLTKQHSTIGQSIRGKVIDSILK